MNCEISQDRVINARATQWKEMPHTRTRRLYHRYRPFHWNHESNDVIAIHISLFIRRLCVRVVFSYSTYVFLMWKSCIWRKTRPCINIVYQAKINSKREKNNNNSTKIHRRSNGIQQTLCRVYGRSAVARQTSNFHSFCPFHSSNGLQMLPTKRTNRTFLSVYSLVYRTNDLF